MSISIFKTKTCVKCRQLADYLNKKGKQFNEIYIDDEPKLQQMVFDKSGGFLQVPFTVIEKDGQLHYVSGYNLARINELVL